MVDVEVPNRSTSMIVALPGWGVRSLPFRTPLLRLIWNLSPAAGCHTAALLVRIDVSWLLSVVGAANTAVARHALAMAVFMFGDVEKSKDEVELINAL
jgi:hypothetical protein